MSTETGAGLRAQDPLLATVENLARFHREHEKFYAEAPLEEAIRLRRIARGLEALAERWATTPPSRQPLPVPFAGAPDLNDERAIETLGVLFMEDGCEPAELAAIKAELRTLAAGHRATGQWLTKAMDAGWAMAHRLLDYPELVDLLAERHRIITTDWQTASLSTVIGHTVDRAVDVLDRVDFTPAAIRADLAGERHASRLMFCACELLDHAAGLAATGAALTQENDRRWRVFQDRVHDLSHPAAAPGPSSAG